MFLEVCVEQGQWLDGVSSIISIAVEVPSSPSGQELKLYFSTFSF